MNLPNLDKPPTDAQRRLVCELSHELGYCSVHEAAGALLDVLTTRADYSKLIGVMLNKVRENRRVERETRAQWPSENWGHERDQDEYDSLSYGEEDH